AAPRDGPPPGRRRHRRERWSGRRTGRSQRSHLSGGGSRRVVGGCGGAAAGAAAQAAVYPPSIERIEPVTKLLASDARYTAAPASSSGSPGRLIGVIRFDWSICGPPAS